MDACSHTTADRRGAHGCAPWRSDLSPPPPPPPGLQTLLAGGGKLLGSSAADAVSFDKQLYIFGGVASFDELESISSQCAHICNRCGTEQHRGGGRLLTSGPIWTHLGPHLEEGGWSPTGATRLEMAAGRVWGRSAADSTPAPHPPPQGARHPGTTACSQAGGSAAGSGAVFRLGGRAGRAQRGRGGGAAGGGVRGGAGGCLPPPGSPGQALAAQGTGVCSIHAAPAGPGRQLSSPWGVARRRQQPGGSGCCRRRGRWRSR